MLKGQLALQVLNINEHTNHITPNMKYFQIHKHVHVQCFSIKAVVMRSIHLIAANLTHDKTVHDKTIQNYNQATPVHKLFIFPLT